MKSFTAEQIRNVGFIGHGGTGKTSLIETLLYLTGVSDRVGKVGDNSSIMDYDPDEVKRGCSISASLAFCEWEKNKINILDTPGSNNFIADTPGCIRVCDGAVVVIAADSGIQFYTEKVWGWANDSSLQRLIFINKMDSPEASIKTVLASIHKKFNVRPLLLEMPVGSGEDFVGVVDLVENKYFVYEKGGNGKGVPTDIPPDLEDEVEISRAELIEAVAEADDELIESYLEHGELTPEEFNSGLVSGIRSGQLVPVLCGSALYNIGGDRLLKAILEYLPTPNERAPQIAKSLKDESPVELVPDKSSILSCLVFKTISDPYAGKLTMFRVFTGSLNPDSSVYNATQKSNERVGQLFSLQGKKQIPVSQISAGDIGVVAKLKVTATGDTLTVQNTGIEFEPIIYPKPVLSLALIPKSRADEEKISNALARLGEEDPTLKVDRDVQTHELLLSGMGTVHLDVIIDRMKRRFGVEVNVKPPKVPYRETIRKKTKIQGKHKKQSGGRGQFADTWMEISPLPKGKGYEFENKIVGGAIPKSYIPAVDKGIQEAMAHGVLANCPMVDIKVSLYDGSYHDVDSSELAFKIAGSMGFKKGVLECKPILLEPIMLMEVVISSECVGDVIGDLNSKRGRILGVDASDNQQKVKAYVPMASILNYAAELRALTGGRGDFVMEFDHYDDVPDHLISKIIDNSKKAE